MGLRFGLGFTVQLRVEGIGTGVGFGPKGLGVWSKGLRFWVLA